MRPSTPSPLGWPEGFGPGSPSPSSSARAAVGPSIGAPSVPPIAAPTIRWSTGRRLGASPPEVNEAERVLSHVAAARDRAEQARRVMVRTSPNGTLVEAVEQAERGLREIQRALVSALDGTGPGPLATA